MTAMERAFLIGDGAMADVIRAFDWRTTPLGAVDHWPAALLTALDLCLSSEIPTAIYWGPDLTLLYNDAWIPIAGTQHPAALGRPAREFWGSGWEALSPLCRGVVRDGARVAHRTARLPDDGHRTWTHGMSPIRLADGRPAGVFCQGLRTAAAQPLDDIDSEERLRLALAGGNGVGTWNFDVLNDRVVADPNFARLYGVAVEEAAAGVPASAFLASIHPDDLGRLRDAVAKAVAGGGIFSAEYRILQPSGAIRWVTAYGECILSADGRPLRFPGVAFDVTSRRMAEAALFESEARYRAITNSIAQMIWSSLPSGEPDYFNDRWYDFIGAEPGTAAPASWLDAVHPDDRALVEACWRRSLATGESYHVEHRLRHRCGTHRWVVARALPVCADTGDILRWYGTFTDIHDLKEADERRAFLLALNDQMRSISDPFLAMTTASEALGRTLGAFRAGYGDVTADGATIVVVRDWNRQSADVSLVGHRRAVDELGPRITDLLRTGHTLVVDDCTTDPRVVTGAQWQAFDCRALVVVPLMRDGLLSGIVFVHDDQPHAWSAAEVQLVEDVAQRTWGTVERARIQTRLSESEERFRLVAESAPVMLWMGDTRGECIYLNHAQRTFWGLTDAGLAGFRWGDTVHPDDAPTLIEAMLAAIRGARSFSSEARIRRFDGAYRMIHTEARPRFGPGGSFLGMIGVNVDVTDTRAAEEALRRDAHIFEVLNRTGSALAAELDLGRVVQLVTDAGVELAGAEFGAFFYNVVDDEGERFALSALSGAARSDFDHLGTPAITALFEPTIHGESVVRCEDVLADPRYGRSGPFHGMPAGHLPVRSFLSVPVISRSGEVIGALLFGHRLPNRFDAEHERLLTGIAGQAATAIDNARLFQASERELVERRRAEEALQTLNATLEQRVAEEVAERSKAEAQLRHSQKLEAVGQLTGGIAHDFNNMLAVIIGGLNLVKRKLAKGDTKVDRFIDGAIESAERAASLTKRLLGFSRQQALAPEPLEANRLVSGMTELLSRTLGEHIRVETVLGVGLWRVRADPGQLENAILNLSVNARDAMPEGGALTLETANVYVDDEYAREFDVAPGQYVQIAVTDSGVGMSPEVVAKAFDPFFTTKPVGRGTGLGLSQVYGFVRQSGGHVRIYSEPGVGTSVKIYLPRYYGPEPVTALPGQGARVPARAKEGETVLVVEDEERVRAFSAEALRDLGYQVIETAEAAAALRVVESGVALTLMFTDVVMPVINGRQLADLAKLRRPDLKVLFTTGYTRNAIVHNGMLDAGTQLISKPFTLDELAAKVRQVIDG